MGDYQSRAGLVLLEAFSTSEAKQEKQALDGVQPPEVSPAEGDMIAAHFVPR